MRRFLVVLLFYSVFVGVGFAEVCKHPAFRFPVQVSTNKEIVGIVTELSAKLKGIDVRVCETSVPIVPSVLTKRCWIVLPEDLIQMASVRALKGIIAHEIGHCVLHKDKSASNLIDAFVQEFEADDEAARLVGRDVVIEGLRGIKSYLEKRIDNVVMQKHINTEVDARIKRLGSAPKRRSN